jgi:hypothetical protein
MAVVIEKRFGRATLIGAIQDPRKLLVLYNQAASQHNASSHDKLALWSPDFLKRFDLASEVRPSSR